MLYGSICMEMWLWTQQVFIKWSRIWGELTSSLSRGSYTLPHSERPTDWCTASHDQMANAQWWHINYIYFNLYNCEELTETDIIQHLDVKGNTETNKYLSDKGIKQYLQIFEKNVIKGIIRLVTEYYTLTALRWFLPGF